MLAEGLEEEEKRKPPSSRLKTLTSSGQEAAGTVDLCRQLKATEEFTSPNLRPDIALWSTTTKQVAWKAWKTRRGDGEPGTCWWRLVAGASQGRAKR